MADMERKIKTAHGLLLDVEEFVSTNRSSRDVALRWLAQYLADAITPLLGAARADNYDEDSKQQIAAFRLSEIAAAKAKHEKEIADLDREAAKLKAA